MTDNLSNKINKEKKGKGKFRVRNSSFGTFSRFERDPAYGYPHSTKIPIPDQNPFCGLHI